MRAQLFPLQGQVVGEGADGVGVVCVDGCHADAGVLEVPEDGEGGDVAQGAADEVGGVLGGAGGTGRSAESHADAVFAGEAARRHCHVDLGDGDVGGDLVDERRTGPRDDHGLLWAHGEGPGTICRTLLY